jgi:penicillin-binding protein-related factor A (putative recombinase)
MPVPSGYGATTVDYLCCYRGHFFAIEAKAPGKVPTPRQDYVLEQIRLAGGSTFVIAGEADLDGLIVLLDDLTQESET